MIYFLYLFYNLFCIPSLFLHPRLSFCPFFLFLGATSLEPSPSSWHGVKPLGTASSTVSVGGGLRSITVLLMQCFSIQRVLWGLHGPRGNHVMHYLYWRYLWHSHSAVALCNISLLIYFLANRGLFYQALCTLCTDIMHIMHKIKVSHLNVFLNTCKWPKALKQ